jgi:hypothetical protein
VDAPRPGPNRPAPAEQAGGTSEAPAVAAAPAPEAAPAPPPAATTSATDDAAPSGRAARASAGSARPSGLATRGNPGAANEPDPLPPPLTANEIEKMTKQEAQDALAKVAKARQRADIEEDVQQRLREEFNLLLERCKKP